VIRHLTVGPGRRQHADAANRRYENPATLSEGRSRSPWRPNVASRSSLYRLDTQGSATAAGDANGASAVRVGETREMWRAVTAGGFGGDQEWVPTHAGRLARDVIDQSKIGGVRDVVRYLRRPLALARTGGGRGTDQVRRAVVIRVRDRRRRAGPMPRAAPLGRRRPPDSLSDR